MSRSHTVGMKGGDSRRGAEKGDKCTPKEASYLTQGDTRRRSQRFLNEEEERVTEPMKESKRKASATL